MALSIVVAVLILGLGLLLWDRQLLGEPARLEQYEKFLDRVPDRFRHLPRIMSSEDADFLTGLPSGKDLVPALWSNRRRVLRYTLADLQEEFNALVAVGVMLASSPTAREDSFGVTLMFQALRFRAVCRIMRASSYIPMEHLPGLNPVWLMHQVRDLRSTTRSLLASLTATDMDHLRDQILDK